MIERVSPRRCRSWRCATACRRACARWSWCPTLLTDARRRVEEQIERLEVHYLANAGRRPALRAALGLDGRADGDRAGATTSCSPPRRGRHRPPEPASWPGAGRRRPLPPVPSPAGLERARRGVDGLGAQARQAARAEPAAARRDRHQLSCHPSVRPRGAPAGVRYVITLDADTRLPRGAARQLVGHDGAPAQPPAARSRGGPRRRGLRRAPAAGHAARCRRTARARSSSASSRVRAGIDPYASAVSDVYQDLFGEGSYTGKGIYDVDAFEAALADRVPENTLLSHDLFEGLFARAGLVTDIELVRGLPVELPTSPPARQHRWARGDWQLLPWIVGWAPSADLA